MNPFKIIFLIHKRYNYYIFFFISFVITLILFSILLLTGIFIEAAPPPSISSVNLTSTTCGSTIANGVSAARVGDGITINGSNFGSTNDGVTVNGGTFTVSTWANTSITGTISNTGTLTGNIVVTVGGKTASIAFSLLPCITSLSPSSGGVGSTITINGNEFGADPGSGNYDTTTNNITLNGVAVPTADVFSWDTSTIIFFVPTGSTSGNIIVTATSNTSNAVSFTVLPIPNAPSSLTQSTVGGTLSANTYYYEVSSITSQGKTPPSSAVSITTTGSTSENKISWTPVVGAIEYSVYRGIGSSVMTQYIDTKNTTFIDTGNINWNNIDGSLGNFYSSGIPQLLEYATSVTYNGFLYEIGGVSSSSVYYSQVYGNGELGAWNATSSLPQVVAESTSSEYAGYIYEIGGYNGSATLSTVYYAQIQSNGSLGSWNTTTPLGETSSGGGTAQTAYNSTSIAYNGYLYCIGGTGPGASVYYAPINANGTVGTWTTTTALPSATSSATSVEYNGYIYEISGYTTAAVSSVYYVPINSNGTLGTWTATTALGETSSGGGTAETIYSATSVEYNGYIYEIGGYNGSAAVSSVYYVPINSNGTLGTWTSTNTLPQVTERATSVEDGGYIYEVGGYNGTASLSEVNYTVVHTNGTINLWNNMLSLPEAINQATSVEYAGYVYEIGGSGGTSVYYAPINSDGTTGVWATTSSLLDSTSIATSVVYNGYVYEIGGNISGAASTIVEYAAINSNGSLGTWATTSSLLTASELATSVEYGGYIYEIGGQNSAITTVVEYVAINSNGSLGTWADTTSLTTSSGDAYSTSVVYNGYIYEIGGNASSGAYVSSVYYIAINSNGTLGTSWLATTSLPIVIDRASVVEYNGYIYEIGGYNGSNNISSVYYAQINTDGTLGSWYTTTSIPQALDYSTSVVYNGYIYEIGGNNTGNSAVNTVYYVPVNSNGSLGTLNNTTSLLSGIDGATSVEYAGYIYEIGGISGTTNLSSVYYAQIYNNGNIGSWTLTASLPQAVLYSTSVEYGGYIYVLGGYNGSSNLSEVYYSHINSDGTLGSWNTTTSIGETSSGGGTAEPIEFATSVTYGGYIYFLGGYSSTTSARVSTVYYVPINSDGTLGSWATTTSLPQIISRSTSIVYAGYIYEIGGYGASSDLSTVYSISITSNGALGTAWTTTTSLSFAIQQATSVEYAGYIYVIGGFNTGTQIYSSSVYYAPISSPGVVGTWSSTSYLPQTTEYATSVTYGGYVYEIGGYNGAAFFSSVYSFPIGLLSSASTAYTNTNQNTISWSAVSGATSYKIYRGITSGGEGQYFQVNNGSQLSFIDSGLNTTVTSNPPTTGNTAPTISSSSTNPIGGDIPYNQTYYYKVTAVTSSGETLPSSEVTINANSTIPIPTGLTISTSSIASSTVSSGSWINNTNLLLGASISSTNNPDSLYLLVEIQPKGTAFTSSTTNLVTTGTGVYESSLYSYSGTSIIANIEVSGLSPNTQYHWQAAVIGNGGISSWVAMGGNPDFAIDASSPITNSIGVLGWSSKPSLLFSNGFESGTILTSDSPSGAWTSDGGSALPLIQSSTQGAVLQGNYSVNMTTASAGTSYITNNTFNTSSAQVRFYMYISSVAYAASGDSITLAQISGASGIIASLNLLDTASGPVIQEVNSVGTTNAQGTNIVPLNTWNYIILNININSTTGSLLSYLNGQLQASLSSQNTGVSNMTTLSLGAVTDSTSDSINMNIDNVNVENTSGISVLNYDNPTPYSYPTPYFEFLGGFDNGSAINNYGVYFGTSATGYPSTTQSTEGYASSSLSTAGMYYLNIMIYDNLANSSSININFEYNFYPSGSSSPNAPSSLAQFDSNGTTAITNDTWTSSGVSTNIVFTISMSSPNSTDTLTPEIEIEPNGTAFSGTPNYSGSAVSYSGTSVTGTVDVTGLTNCAGYHWQAFVKNSVGLSSPTVFNTINPNFSVADTAPTAGSVFDGNINGTEVQSTQSISEISSNWTGFSDSCSGLASTPYQVEIGTTPGSNNIYSLSSSGIVLNNPSPYNTDSVSSLSLETGMTYYVTVIATNNAGLSTQVTSSGQSVMPTLSFSLNSTNINMGNWNATNSYTTTNTSTISVLTNAYNGYSIFAYESGLMQSQEGNTIPNFSVGTYASPALWPSGDYGFGYTSSATDINGSNLFSSGTLYAPFSLTGPGDTVAQNTTNITGANYTGNPTAYTIYYKVAVPSTQAAGTYQTNIIYTVVSSF